MPVYQEKDKSKWTKDGRSYYFKCYYTDKDGKRKIKKSIKYKKVRECEQAERKFLTSCNNNKINNNDNNNNGNDNDNSNDNNENITFQNLYDEYWEDKKNLIKVTSYYCKKKRCDKHILTFFKEYKLQEINADALRKFKNNLNLSKLSLSYQNEIISYLQNILKYTHDNYNLDNRIINKLQKNRIDTVTESRDSENNFWTYDEFEKFLNVIDNDFHKLVFMFFYFTGVRVGEFIALTWNDIDLNKKTLKINKSFSNNIENQKFIITDPKTKNSVRWIELDENLVEMLKKHKENEKNIYNFNENMYIFGNVKYIGKTTLRRWLNTYISKADIKKITIHGFRHSHVSLLLNIGLDSRDVAERIGDTVQVVENTYYHMFPEKRSSTVNAINNFNNSKLLYI